MKILIVAPMEQGATGKDVYDEFINMGHNVAYFDWRQLSKDVGIFEMNRLLIDTVKKLTPELTIIIKGLCISAETIKNCKEVHDHKIVGWIYDARLGTELVKDVKVYTDMIKELDIFFTVDYEGISDLKKLDINAMFLQEANYPPKHGETIFNLYQKKKYGADIVFIGSIDPIHKERMMFLEKIHDLGFDFKIYGEVYGDIPDWVKEHHTGYAAIYDKHSLICQASKIVIGTDEYRDRSKCYSARIYRVLGCGGFYLSTKVKDNTEFIPGIHFDEFDNVEELEEKLMFYLTHDDIREKIAEEGKKLVLEKHTMRHRLEQMLQQL